MGTSQREADERHAPDDTDTSGAGDLFDSASNFDFDQLDEPCQLNQIPLEDDMETNAYPSSLTFPTGDNFFQISDGIAGTSHDILGGDLDICNAPASSEYSKISSSPPTGPWHQSVDASNVAPTSMIPPLEVNTADDQWLGSFPENVDVESSLTDFAWRDNLTNFIGPNGISFHNEKSESWASALALPAESFSHAAQPTGSDLYPKEYFNTNCSVKFENRSFDFAQTQPKGFDSEGQQLKKFDKEKLHNIIVEIMKSRLRQRTQSCLSPRPPSVRQSPIEGIESLAPLIKQCLSSLKRSKSRATEMPKERIGLQNRLKLDISWMNEELRITVDSLWSALAGSSCHNPAHLRV
jgi:hypothetical protein